MLHITHACIAASVVRVFSRVCLSVFCLFVRALTIKRLELLTPNLVHVYSIAFARHALTQRPKVKVTWLRKSSRRTVASDYSRRPVTMLC